MSLSTSSATVTPVAPVAQGQTLSVGWLSSPRSALVPKLRDFIQLAKPRISVMVLITVAVGFLLAPQSEISLSLLVATLAGVGLLGTASNVINQVLERDADRLMPRTAGRPLPTGRLSIQEGWLFGSACTVIGLYVLWTQVNVATCLMTALTLLLYVGCYTPLKRRSALCTTVGAIPGALPPVLGWLGAGGSFGAEALALFGLLFLWQYPHFLAIAWLHQDQYRQAGMKMLPAGGQGPIVGAVAVSHAAALLVISLWPRALGMAGELYATTALVLGTAYLLAAILFWRIPSRLTARRLLWTSLGYLPIVLGLLTWDHWRLLS